MIDKVWYDFCGTFDHLLVKAHSGGNMDYQSQVRRLLEELSPEALSSQTDQVWNDWLGLVHEREQRHLRELLQSNCRQEFKVRALVVLLAPSLGLLPFAWSKVDPQWRYLDHQWVEPQSLPQELLRITCELVCIGAEYTSQQKEPDIRYALNHYYRFILCLLAILLEADPLAERLFAHYGINDPNSFSGGEESSGYQPLAAILSDSSVPLVWKRRADMQMRERIVAEYEGREQPRAEWENALRCYTNLLTNLLDRANYPHELLHSQVNFVLDLPNIEAYPGLLFRDWDIGRFLQLLNGERRHRLARQAVLGNTQHHFNAFGKESRQAVQQMFAEFGNSDEPLSAKLTLLIQQAEQRDAENAAYRQRELHKTSAVLAQMT